jgi:hypothetical protein
MTPHEKALAINLDANRYGTFAEIGAGQEVSRWFFRVGGAAGTIAKSISAYDMTVSDAIYGKCPRYVCRDRLQSMLDYEHELNLTRLRERRGDDTAFFSFADAVVARSYRGGGECHGWLGVVFQSHPRDQDSRIILHVRMLDDEADSQQEALGIVGVNLLYGAFFLYHDPDALVASLLDGLSTDRIEIDMIELSGIEFRHVDARVMSLRLVQLGLSGAAMFAADGSVLQPSEVLRHKPVLVERGRFRPVTHVNLDLMRCASTDFEQSEGEPPVRLMEMAMHHLLGEGDLDLRDFLARVEALSAAGEIVLISDYFEYDRLAGYLAKFTDRTLALAMGARDLAPLFGEDRAQHAGELLESFGRLLRNDARLYIYPWRDPESGQLATADTLEVPESLRHFYQFLLQAGQVRALEGYDESVLGIFSPEVLKSIQAGDAAWEAQVPAAVAEVIRKRKLFGYRE